VVELPPNAHEIKIGVPCPLKNAVPLC
jgi:hypothetical protein